jgi:gas vesicle protein
MSEIETGKNLSRYVLLGSFFGGLVGATIAMLVFPEPAEEKKKHIKELQQELLKPVKIKFAEVVEHVGDTFKKVIDEAVQQPETKESSGELESSTPTKS